MSRQKIYKEMQELLGIVPSMFKEVPDATLELEWHLLKEVQFSKGTIPSKYRDLIGLAVSATLECKYCIYFNTELAKLDGATKEEIEEALHIAKSTVGWGTYIAGLQIDFEKFKKEIKQASLHIKRIQAEKRLSRKP